MSFWTGLEAFTGHRPGAFTGMTMKDLFDNDMWKRLPKTWSGKMGTEAYLKANPTEQMFSRGGEPMYTKWFDKNAGVREEITSRNRTDQIPMFSSPMQPEGALAGPPQYPQTRALPPRPNLIPQPVPGWTPPRTQAEMVQEIGPYTGMGDAYSGWGGYIGSAKNAHMGMGASGYQVPPVPQFDSTMADMTTVKKITDDASPNTITQTIKQQVPANPTKTLMNMNQPGFLEKLGTGIGEQWSNLWDGSVLRHGAGAWDAMKDLSRKRYEEEMLRRQRGY